jgi:hypothetical protein
VSRPLPYDVAKSREWQTASLGLKYVWQSIRPRVDDDVAPVVEGRTPADTLVMLAGLRHAIITPAEATEIITEGRRLGLFDVELVEAAQFLTIRALPPSVEAERYEERTGPNGGLTGRARMRRLRREKRSPTATPSTSSTPTTSTSTSSPTATPSTSSTPTTSTSTSSPAATPSTSSTPTTSTSTSSPAATPSTGSNPSQIRHGGARPDGVPRVSTPPKGGVKPQESPIATPNTKHRKPWTPVQEPVEPAGLVRPSRPTPPPGYRLPSPAERAAGEAEANGYIRLPEGYATPVPASPGAEEAPRAIGDAE